MPRIDFTSRLTTVSETGDKATEIAGNTKASSSAGGWFAKMALRPSMETEPPSGGTLSSSLWRPALRTTYRKQA